MWLYNVAPAGAKDHGAYVYQESFAHSVQYETAQEAHSTRYSGAIVAIPDWHLPQHRPRTGCDWRYGRSRPHAFSFAAQPFAWRRDAPSQDQFIQMDERAPQGLRLAGRLRSLRGQRVQLAAGGELHSQPGNAPPQDEL